MPDNFEPGEVLANAVTSGYFLPPIVFRVEAIYNEAIPPHHIDTFGEFGPASVVIARIGNIPDFRCDMHRGVDGIAGEFQLVQRVLKQSVL